MMRITTLSLALASLLILSLPRTSLAQSGFLGLGGDTQNPSVAILPTEIEIELPISSIDSSNLAQLLSQAGKGGGLAAMMEEEVRKYRRHLENELDARLRAFFTEEKVPLVNSEPQLSLSKALKISVIKHFNDLQSQDGYDLERGNVELIGKFHYQLKDASGHLLQKEEVDIGKFKIRENYQVKSAKGGGAKKEDTTEQAIKLALSQMVERIIDKIDGDLEAGELRDLVSE